jgi:hypothetical protein
MLNEQTFEGVDANFLLINPTFAITGLVVTANSVEVFLIKTPTGSDRPLSPPGQLSI